MEFLVILAIGFLAVGAANVVGNGAGSGNGSVLNGTKQRPTSLGTETRRNGNATVETVTEELMNVVLSSPGESPYELFVEDLRANFGKVPAKVDASDENLLPGVSGEIPKVRR